MSGEILVPPIHYWSCPSCGLQDRTQRSDVHTQMHNCPAIGNIAIPLVEVARPDAKVDARHVLVNRDDYAGDANPLTAIRTERGDGSNDVTVMAEVAQIKLTS